MPRGGKREGSGRPRGSKSKPDPLKKELREVARGYTHEAIEALVRIMRDKKAPHAAVVSAANAVIDRGHGKPTQILEVKRTPFDDMSPDELRALAEAIEALPDHQSGPVGGNSPAAGNGTAGRISAVH